MSKITVVYNNIEGDKRLKTGWGSSILLEHDNELILFDTGPNAEDLFFNLEILGIERRKINKVVISHKHSDHKGALDGVLGKLSKDVELFLPDAVKKKKEIANRVYIYTIKSLTLEENVLAIDSAEGLILLTCCAHPGIYKICKKIKDDFGKPVYAVLGGFHFEYYPSLFVKILGNLLKNLGIKILGPNHCTGGRAVEILRRIFKEDLLDFGSGRSFLA